MYNNNYWGGYDNYDNYNPFYYNNTQAWRQYHPRRHFMMRNMRLRRRRW